MCPILTEWFKNLNIEFQTQNQQFKNKLTELELIVKSKIDAHDLYINLKVKKEKIRKFIESNCDILKENLQHVPTSLELASKLNLNNSDVVTCLRENPSLDYLGIKSFHDDLKKHLPIDQIYDAYQILSKQLDRNPSKKEMANYLNTTIKEISHFKHMNTETMFSKN